MKSMEIKIGKVCGDLITEGGVKNVTQTFHCYGKTVVSTSEEGDIRMEKQASANERDEKESSSFVLLVRKPDRVDAVLQKLHELVDRQSEPREVVMPIRAAMDAGVIGRPTWVQFCSEFGADKLSSKSSLSKYTGEGYTYYGEDFLMIKEDFRKFLV